MFDQLVRQIKICPACKKPEGVLSGFGKYKVIFKCGACGQLYPLEFFVSPRPGAKDMIPTKEKNPEGLHQRYSVKKIYGNTDTAAQYFVLRIDALGDDPIHLAACQQAARVYANQIKDHLPQLSADLHRLLDTNEAALAQRLAANGDGTGEVSDESITHLGQHNPPEPDAEKGEA